MDSHTHESILAHQILPGADGPQPWAYTQPTWVFTSRELPVIPGADIRFLCGGVRHVHGAMTQAAAGKNIWVMGGEDLAGPFHDHGLLDEFIVSIASVAPGSGAPLLPRRSTTPPRKLVSAQALGAGFVQLTYEVTTTRTG